MVRSASNETMMRESRVKEKKKTLTETVHETGHGVRVTRYVPTSGGGGELGKAPDAVPINSWWRGELGKSPDAVRIDRW
jgi:hypothetical protein